MTLGFDAARPRPRPHADRERGATRTDRSDSGEWRRGVRGWHGGSDPGGWPALIGLCVSCLGVGSATAAGAATGAGISIGGLLAGVVVLVAMAAFQLTRLGRRCPAGPSRRRRGARGLATLTGMAVLSFALMQWVVAPVLTPNTPAGPPAEQLP